MLKIYYFVGTENKYLSLYWLIYVYMHFSMWKYEDMSILAFV